MADSSYFLIALRIYREAIYKLRQHKTEAEQAEARIKQNELHAKQTIEFKAAKRAEVAKDQYHHGLQNNALFTVALSQLSSLEQCGKPKNFPQLNELESRLLGFLTGNSQAEIRKDISERISVLREAWQAPYEKEHADNWAAAGLAVEEWKQNGGPERELQALEQAVKIDRSLANKVGKPNYWKNRKELYEKHKLDWTLLGNEPEENERQLALAQRAPKKDA